MKISAPVNCSSHESTFVPFIIFVALPILFPFYYLLCFVVLGLEQDATGGTKLFNKTAFQISFISRTSTFLNCS